MQTNKGNEELNNLFKEQEELDLRRAKILKKKIEKLSQQITNGATEEVTHLRTILGVAKEKLMEQNILLQQLTAPPLVLAFVLRVDAVARQINFEVGMKVRVVPNAPDSEHKGEVGKITQAANNQGEIWVRFSNGDNERFFTGSFPVGLEIIDNPEPKIEDFQIGVRVKIIDKNYDGLSNYVGETGNIVEIHDNPKFRGWRRVETSDGENAHWYWIGMLYPSVEVELENNFSDTALVLHEGKQIEVELPSDKEIKPGDTVKLSMQTMQIVDVAEPVYAGEISIVRRVIDDKTSEVEHNGAIRVVLNGKLPNKPETGDRVVLDSNALLINMNLGKEDERFSFTAATNVAWEDIGGLVEAKKQMIEAIELPFRYPDIYKHYGKKPIKGVLLYGPPGCGKTMLGKAAATALANLHSGNSAPSSFIYVKGPEILDRFVGVAEATIRQIFQRSRKHKETHGYPAVIFIDEADAILGKRGMGISSDIERTIVPAFLAEMDGLEETGAIVLLATNRADILDPAVTRDGRVDRKVKVTRPDLNASKDIFQLYLKSVPLYNDYTREELSDVAALEMFSEKRVLYSIQLKGNHKGQSRNFTLGHLASGAMVAGIVDQATSIALHRDISSGKPQGMSKDDLMQAVECTFQQNFDLNHNDEMADFVHDFRDDVIGIRKLRQGIGAATVN